MTGASVTTEPQISVVIPAFNEEGSLTPLCARIREILVKLEQSWEVILVDDGSRDTTWQEIEEIHLTEQRIKGLRLSRNFGHQYALLAGLKNARGQAVIMMDADLQHPPELIPQLVSAWRQGAKVVNTLRHDPEDVPLFKKMTSRWFYRIFSYLTGVELQSGMADFRLLDRQVLQDILQLREEGLFLRGIVTWVGYRSVNIPFNCLPRQFGQTKYTLKKMLQFAWHGISSFSLVPLRLGVLLGFMASGLSFCGIVYAIYSKVIAGEAVPGWASSLAIMSFLFGVLFIFLGILGEYLGRILLEVRLRPRFIVSEGLGLDGIRKDHEMDVPHQ